MEQADEQPRPDFKMGPDEPGDMTGPPAVSEVMRRAVETVVAAARALRERGIKSYLGPVDIGDGDTVVDGEAIVLAEPNPQAVRSIDGVQVTRR